MISLHEQLIEEKFFEKFTCTHLQTMVFDIYLNCLQNIQRENKLVTIIDLCSIAYDNLQILTDMFLNMNNIYINLHQLLIETGRSCGAEINDSTLHTVPSLLILISLDRKNARLKEDITKIMFNQRFDPSDYDWISS